MIKLKAVDNGSDIEVSKEIFDYPFNEGLVHQAVTAYMNAARSGNSAQKTRSEVRGGGKKPWNQKGTGRARAGTICSPIWRSGGVTFAAKPRDYSQKMPKKMYRRAIRSIVSELQRTGSMMVVSAFDCETPKTSEFSAKMKSLECDGALIILHEMSENVYLGSRNLHKFEIVDTCAMNPYSLLKHPKVIITEQALKMVEEQLK